jgi:hypothetical protein
MYRAFLVFFPLGKKVVPRPTVLEGAPSFAPLFYAKGGLLRFNATNFPL